MQLTTELDGRQEEVKKFCKQIGLEKWNEVGVKNWKNKVV